MNLAARLTRIERMVRPPAPDQKPTVFDAETVRAYRGVVEACVEHLDSRHTSAFCNGRVPGNDDIQGQGRYWARRLASIYLHIKYCGSPHEIEMIRTNQDPRMAFIARLVKHLLGKKGEGK